MKIRNGFVSNSSSSSFVIAGNGSTKFKIEADLADFGEVLITEKEIKDYFFKDTGVNTIEELKEYCEYTYDSCIKALQAVKDGEKVVVGLVGNEDGDAMECYLYRNIEDIDIPGYEFIQRGN